MIECSQLCYKNEGNLPLLELLPHKKGKVLDCGCGSGDNARILKERGWAVTGITISRKELRIAQEYCNKCYLYDLNKGIPDTVGGGYNVVLMSHILEHVINPDYLLKDVKRVLSPDGVIAVALPNILTYTNRLRFLFGKFEYTEGGTLDHTHIRFYTFTSGKRLLEENGFNVIVARGDGAFPLWKIRSILPSILVKRLNQLACKFRPGLFSIQSLFIANQSK